MLCREGDDTCVAPESRRNGARGVIIRRHTPRCGVLRDMCMRFYAPRHDQFITRVNLIWRTQIRPKGCDLSVLNADVCREHL